MNISKETPLNRMQSIFAAMTLTVATPAITLAQQPAPQAPLQPMSFIASAGLGQSANLGGLPDADYIRRIYSLFRCLPQEDAPREDFKRKNESLS